jgi:hypothetical protein
MNLPTVIPVQDSMVRLCRNLALIASALIATACALPERRHSADDIAGYATRDFQAEIASATGRETAHQEAMAQIEAGLGAENDPSAWVAALQAAMFTGQSYAVLDRLLARALPQISKMTVAQQRTVLSVAHAHRAAFAAKEVRQQLLAIKTPREFAIAAYLLLRAAWDDPGQQAVERERLLRLLRTQFDFDPYALDNLDVGEPRLLALAGVLRGFEQQARAAPPPLGDLLAAPFVPGWPVVFSFQRPDRQSFGLALVRGPDGRFVREADGRLFQVPQLALALTELPGTLTNGNTPRGLFTIIGSGTATNRWIGPTPYLESKVPHEAKVADFLHRPDLALPWTHAQYREWLPRSWQGDWLMQEAYLAGRAGRDEMIIHGTTIDTHYYAGRSYAPGTPSAGCLVAMEQWSPIDGRLTVSDQLSLIKAFTRGGQERGFLVVVELAAAQPGPVTLDEVAPTIRALGL